MSDAPTEPDAVFDRRALRRAIKTGDVETLEVTLAGIEEASALDRAIRVIVRLRPEAPDPEAVSDVLRRRLDSYFGALPSDGSGDAAAQSLMRGARKEVLAAADAAFAAGTDRPLLMRLAMEAAYEAGDAARCVALATDLLTRRPITEHHLVAATQLRNIGLLAPVQDWIEAVQASGEIETATPAIQQGFAQRARFGGRGVDDDTLMSVHVRPGSRSVLFVFCGLNNLPGVADETLIAQMADVDAHLVILRDPHGLIYLKGVAPLGGDMAATAQGMVDLAAGLGAERILCFGTSAGGYAALRYGLMVGAERVIGFGALTLLTAERCRVRADGRAAGLGQRLVDEVEAQLGDCRPMLEARDPPMQVDLYFGEKMPLDRFQAEHVDGVPGVRLHPLEGVGTHAVVSNLHNAGRLGDILKAFVEA